MTTDGMELIWHYNDNSSFTGNNSQPYIIPK